jgi:hypothetical protein
MKVTEKLNQAELSISSSDSSEWAPHAIETVAVKAPKKPGQSLRGNARDLGICPAPLVKRAKMR